jgi:S-adenosylmethionine synthetase
MRMPIARTAEQVTKGHPDKFCDQVADHILDKALGLCRDCKELHKAVRTGIECLVKENLLMVTGEVTVPDEVKAGLDVVKLAREVWAEVGYTDKGKLIIISHIRPQSPDIAGKHAVGTHERGADEGGAGDQGIMVGYATDETEEMMPQEWIYARDLCMELTKLRENKILPWLKADGKSQVTVDANGRVVSVVLAAHHSKVISTRDLRKELKNLVIRKVIGDKLAKDCRILINGTGLFVRGGPFADAGVVGRKIVADAYGPRVPVGGGAYSGKDPSKVDRSAAYMARLIAKKIVKEKVRGAKECTVTLAYCIGQVQPEMITAITDKGRDVSDWVKRNYTDLSPRNIIDQLGLLYPGLEHGWSYCKASANGHYGRDIFPWECV